MWKYSIVEVKDRVYGLDFRLVEAVMFQLGQVDSWTFNINGVELSKLVESHIHQFYLVTSEHKTCITF